MKRQKIFKLFSLIFSFPTEETINEMRKLVEEIPEYSHVVEELTKMSLKDLQTEYTRLFVSSYPTLKCHPYESFYREGLVYGESTVEVREIYESRGLKYTYLSEPPDHVSVELEFLALTDDQEFFNRMKEWIFKFTERVKKHSKVYDLAAEELEKIFEGKE
ncbi:cytoplasmic chaperone TorD family protein [Ferroglobus placidus DSM 10642]|uniref:Cytoplasmic chaperone TorD family protein n=1 Tax=Ferroglobus placidus (strain DSM 10642 / AEDII12DO) TaxID=589924 RepID=D3S173_FERPA|nr:molecular chaperone TorD family protein [Ferroglobus placidus]ADC64309.1 cytoplasmic chaperone TorD family protein [Ferroglobus placidus DSM 10642]